MEKQSNCGLTGATGVASANHAQKGRQARSMGALGKKGKSRGKPQGREGQGKLSTNERAKRIYSQRRKREGEQ